MKRFFNMLIVGLLVSTISMAQNLNDEQLALRSDLLNFLKVEGFTPTIDSDGDISFKYEGHPYYIRVVEKDVDPMYVTIFRTFSYPEDYSRETFVLATKELNTYKGVKVLCFDNSVQIRTEMYVKDAKAVEVAMYKVLRNIASAASDVIAECENAGALVTSVNSVTEVPFLITSMEVANVDKAGNIIQDYGVLIWDSKSRYLKPKITVKPFKTSGTYTLYVKLYNSSGSLATGTSSPAGYSYSNNVTLSGSGSQTFYLSGWGSDTSGHWSAGEYRFEVWYGDYCIGSKTFKII
jgi:hypothetical protein